MAESTWLNMAELGLCQHVAVGGKLQLNLDQVQKTRNSLVSCKTSLKVISGSEKTSNWRGLYHFIKMFSRSLNANLEGSLPLHILKTIGGQLKGKYCGFLGCRH